MGGIHPSGAGFWPYMCNSPKNIISMDAKHEQTSGPVNAYRIPGPGIYFNAFIHVYSPRAGADNPLGTNVDVNR